ncbi:MAG: transposase [Candidatus Latescibacterota bacterium]
MAKPKSKPQRSFFDADTFSHLLGPKADAVYLTIKNVIAPLIRDEDYAEMYSHLGRSPVSPRTLVLATLLQILENLSDRRASRNVRLSLAWKAVIGLAVDDSGFHFSALGEFRDRLEAHNKERAAFGALLEKLKEVGLIREHQKQRLDSTHVGKSVPFSPIWSFAQVDSPSIGLSQPIESVGVYGRKHASFTEATC